MSERAKRPEDNVDCFTQDVRSGAVVLVSDRATWHTGDAGRLRTKKRLKPGNGIEGHRPPLPKELTHLCGWGCEGATEVALGGPIQDSDRHVPPTASDAISWRATGAGNRANTSSTTDTCKVTSGSKSQPDRVRRSLNRNDTRGHRGDWRRSNDRARMNPAQPNRREWGRIAHRPHDTPVAATAGLRTRPGMSRVYWMGAWWLDPRTTGGDFSTQLSTTPIPRLETIQTVVPIIGTVRRLQQARAGRLSRHDSSVGHVLWCGRLGCTLQAGRPHHNNNKWAP